MKDSGVLVGKGGVRLPSALGDEGGVNKCGGGSGGGICEDKYEAAVIGATEADTERLWVNLRLLLLVQCFFSCWDIGSKVFPDHSEEVPTLLLLNTGCSCSRSSSSSRCSGSCVTLISTGAVSMASKKDSGVLSGSEGTGDAGLPPSPRRASAAALGGMMTSNLSQGSKVSEGPSLVSASAASR